MAVYAKKREEEDMIDRPMRVALPSKGRLSERALELFELAGLRPAFLAERALVASLGDFEAIFVRAADIPEYVADGAAEVGVTGADCVAESGRKVAEVEIPIRLALLAAPGTSLSTVTYVGSHPAALAQCSRFLAAHPALTPCPAWDTAGAARELGAEIGPKWYDRLPGATRKTVAAIASPATAGRYGLELLIDSVQDRPEAITRFAVIAPRRGER